MEASLPIYIYSMPKAGTYFFSTLLEKLGLEDTGIHLGRDTYLDTKAHSLAVNIATPSKAAVKRFFVPVVRELAPRAVLVGHFPLPINFNVLGPKGCYICAYRDPRKTLVSEFIDFRYRRQDVPWLAPEVLTDDRAAFTVFMKRHGVVGHLNIFTEFVLLRSMVVSPLGPPILQKKTYFVNFDQVRDKPETAAGIAQFLGIELADNEVMAAVHAALGAETKTRATELSLDRDALWSDEAEALYAASTFPAIKAMAESLGLEF